MRRTWYVAAIVATLVLAVRPARALVVFEYYERERPADADTPVGMLLEQLERARPDAVWAKPSTVRDKLELVAFAPGITDRDLTAQELLANLNIGYKAYLDGRYDQAIPQLVTAIAQGHANPALLVSSSKYRGAMLDAMVGLTVSYHRRNKGDDRKRGDEVLHELIRSFPDRLATFRDEYGPEPYGLYKKASRSLLAKGTGRLAIDVDDPSALIFVNEKDPPQNATFEANLPPGVYRVLIKRPASNGRRYDVEVRPNATAKLSVDWDQTANLSTSERWVGFAGIRETDAARYARKLLGRTRQTEMVLVTLTTWEGAPALKATVYDVARSEAVRAHVVPLGDHLDQRVAALASAILDRASSPIVIDVQRPAPKPAAATHVVAQPAPSSSSDGGRDRGLLPWLAGGAGVVAFAAGGYLFHIDGSCIVAPAGPGLPCREFRKTKAPAIGVVAGGVALTSLALYLALRKPRRPRAAFLQPTRGGLEVAWVTAW